MPGVIGGWDKEMNGGRKPGGEDLCDLLEIGEEHAKREGKGSLSGRSLTELGETEGLGLEERG